MKPWEFWIDVGGTFTDCLARTPEDKLLSFKLLSTGITKGQIAECVSPVRFVDPARCGDPPKFWIGHSVRLFDPQGSPIFASRVSDFERRTGAFTVAAVLPLELPEVTHYELASGEEAPITAIRYLMGLRRDQEIPPVHVRLGTTRGTNALLTRRGARTAFVTTRGFADVLLIANQDRPRLFDLAIHKPEPLFERVAEIDERVDVHGEVLQAPDPAAVRQQLAALKQAGIESVAICLLHGFAHPAHERLVEALAREVGFTEISTSSRLSPLIKIVSRGDTTVVDAYLNPVLRDYMQQLRAPLGLVEAVASIPAVVDPSTDVQSLSEKPLESSSGVSRVRSNPGHPAEELLEGGRGWTEGKPRSPEGGGSLKIMTSAGGLVDAARFVGKDSILSGPAGGVIGYSRVAQAAGFEKSIGFDMGGTSTDVSRFDGRYELEFETKKAGVRVVAPMLAIETVAAGGGSICDFDGVKLVVGPNSAGAQPGPACYGRGGPLTVTDMNFFAGKLLSSRFPFPLNRDAVERQLKRLCERIAQAHGGTQYTPLELAEGFLKVANANMVRPIRNISVAKGYDPREYVLVTFGGAGAQHACAIARALGMRKILAHPLAGVLSAYGIGLADVRRFGEQAVLKPYSPSQVAELEPLFVELERSACEQVRAEGIPEESILPSVRSLDLRYQGIEAAINVPRPADGDYARRYAELHQQLYGYCHSGRTLEITAARVEVVGMTPNPPEEVQDLFVRRPAPSEMTIASFDGTSREAAVFSREQLHPGDEIQGPAILCEPTSTVVIDPGFSARILARGEILITDDAGLGHEAISTVADPVMLEIFNNLFASIAEQMGTTLQRTAFSTNVKERLDFSCAVFSPQGDLVVNAPHIPVHLGAMSETVKRVLLDNPRIVPGDVYVTNDPYRGGSHLPDVTVVSPVHHTESGELLFFTASRAHHAEIGGIVPGSMPPFSKNLAEEGVLIRNFKLVDGGTSREADLQTLLSAPPFPSRAVRDNLADVSAQVAANHRGAVQLQELVERYSLPVVQAYMQHIQDAAARKMRMALDALPDGDYAMTDHLDDGSPISVRITIHGDSATVDFSGTGPVVPGNLNANRAIVTAAVLYVFRCLINEDIPLNSGVLAPVTIILPECLLNPPERAEPGQSAAVVGGNVETSSRVVDTLLGALKGAAASQGTMNNLTFGNDRFGYYETICGGSGATPGSDGADAVHTHMTNTRLTDPEVIERRYPVRVREFSIRRGSGGAGRFHGGAGIVRRLEFLSPLRVSILSERRGPYPPFGLAGGEPGALGKNSLQRAGGSEVEDLGGKVQIDVQPGDLLTIETPGGGGYGPVGAKS